MASESPETASPVLHRGDEVPEREHLVRHDTRLSPTPCVPTVATNDGSAVVGSENSLADICRQIDGIASHMEAEMAAYADEECYVVDTSGSAAASTDNAGGLLRPGVHGGQSKGLHKGAGGSMHVDSFRSSSATARMMAMLETPRLPASCTPRQQRDDGSSNNEATTTATTANMTSGQRRKQLVSFLVESGTEIGALLADGLSHAQQVFSATCDDVCGDIIAVEDSLAQLESMESVRRQTELCNAIAEQKAAVQRAGGLGGGAADRRSTVRSPSVDWGSPSPQRVEETGPLWGAMVYPPFTTNNNSNDSSTSDSTAERTVRGSRPLASAWLGVASSIARSAGSATVMKRKFDSTNPAAATTAAAATGSASGGGHQNIAPCCYHAVGEPVGRDLIDAVWARTSAAAGVRQLDGQSRRRKPVPSTATVPSVSTTNCDKLGNRSTVALSKTEGKLALSSSPPPAPPPPPPPPPAPPRLNLLRHAADACDDAPRHGNLCDDDHRQQQRYIHPSGVSSEDGGSGKLSMSSAADSSRDYDSTNHNVTRQGLDLRGGSSGSLDDSSVMDDVTGPMFVGSVPRSSRSAGVPEKLPTVSSSLLFGSRRGKSEGSAVGSQHSSASSVPSHAQMMEELTGRFKLQDIG